MKGAGRLAIVALALGAASATAAKAEETFRVAVGDRSARVLVPKLYEPLLPGSVYPNRRRTRAPHAIPVAIVEKDLAPRIEKLLLARGYAVAELESIDRTASDRLLEQLASRIEGGTGGAVLVARRPGDALSDPKIRAAALFDAPGAAALAPAGPGSIPVLLLRLARPASEPAAPIHGVEERWYRAAERFPDEAFRDAAEWLAAVSTASDGRSSGVR